MKRYFSNWNYKKHFKFVTIFYGVLYAIDMTLGYVLIKKISKSNRITKKA